MIRAENAIVAYECWNNALRSTGKISRSRIPLNVIGMLARASNHRIVAFQCERVNEGV